MISFCLFSLSLLTFIGARLVQEVSIGRARGAREAGEGRVCCVLVFFFIVVILVRGRKKETRGVRVQGKGKAAPQSIGESKFLPRPFVVVIFESKLRFLVGIFKRSTPSGGRISFTKQP